MKKMTLQQDTQMTLADGCKKHYEYCRQRNLREGTLLHYQQGYNHFCSYFGADMPLSEITKSKYNDYIEYQRDNLDNEITLKTYVKDFATVLHFLMEEGYIEPFKTQSIKASGTHVETYTDEELQVLLRKPNLKTCTFREYESWVIVNFLFSTGVRRRSLINIRISDIDFENALVTIRVTKNGKVLIIPLNKTMITILQEFLKHRQHKSKDDWLFCNVYGKKLLKDTLYHILWDYNKGRGIETTGIHRYRHTFAKQWILNGGNVVALSRLLGHSNLNITQNYINLLTTDLSKQVDEINLLDKYAVKQRIKM